MLFVLNQTGPHKYERQWAPPRPVPGRTSGKRTNSDSDLIRIRLSHHRAGPGPPDPIAHHPRAGPANALTPSARAVLLIEEEMRTHSAILPVPGAESSAAMRLPAARLECWTRLLLLAVVQAQAQAQAQALAGG